MSERNESPEDRLARRGIREIELRLPAEKPRPNGGARDYRSADETAPDASLPFMTLGAFVAEYVPLSYVFEPIIRDGSLYSLTARTGAGKTALMVIMALAVATGRRDILNLEVVKGRVAYLTAENPEDARMRFMIACYLLNIDFAEIKDRIVILPRRARPEDIVATLTRLAGKEPFALVLIDTLAAYFDGKNINDPVEGGDFLRRIRPTTRIQGLPAVIVAAHPVKNAAADNLLPYGAGAILNEVDGNLTLWKQETANVALHWQGKPRGLEFEPMFFRFEIAGSPEVLDAKGRQVQLPTMRPCTEADGEERERSEVNIDAALLRAMRDDPGGKQADWARAIGRDKSNVNRRLQKLKGDKLVDMLLGQWAVTPKGEKALKPGEN